MNDDSGDLDLFYRKVKFGPLDFEIGRTEKVLLSGAVVLSDIKMI